MSIEVLAKSADRRVFETTRKDNELLQQIRNLTEQLSPAVRPGVSLPPPPVDNLIEIKRVHICGGECSARSEHDCGCEAEVYFGARAEEARQAVLAWRAKNPDHAPGSWLSSPRGRWSARIRGRDMYNPSDATILAALT